MERVTALVTLFIFIFATIISCASSPGEIKADYISPYRYNNWSCEQISEELIRVESNLRQVTATQQKKANTDAVGMGIGMILFWPALFLLAAGDDKEKELSQLKGQRDALKTIFDKKCVRQSREIEAKQS